jgi:hypothetical protein
VGLGSWLSDWKGERVGQCDEVEGIVNDWILLQIRHEKYVPTLTSLRLRSNLQVPLYYERLITN